MGDGGRVEDEQVGTAYRDADGALRCVYLSLPPAKAGLTRSKESRRRMARYCPLHPPRRPSPLLHLHHRLLSRLLQQPATTVRCFPPPPYFSKLTKLLSSQTFRGGLVDLAYAHRYLDRLCRFVRSLPLFSLIQSFSDPPLEQRQVGRLLRHRRRRSLHRRGSMEQAR